MSSHPEPPSMVAVLVEKRGDVERHLRLAPITTIGRGLANTHWLDDPAMSRRHAEITRLSDGQHEIVDLDSRWGVIVQGTKVRRRLLADGDVIILGTTQLVFRVLSQPRSRTWRWAKRYRCDLCVRVTLPSGRRVSARATDISTSGLRLILQEQVTCDSIVELAITFPEQLFRARLKGQVVDEAPKENSIGLAFIFTSKRARRKIVRGVATLMAGQPEDL